mmetsp:Transcript_3157/g.6339  ORF Transcript_3157/g.6339 Transcript_3157/m.6339 type:complete len:322 (+) Transcript_3157:109-1074(+)
MKLGAVVFALFGATSHAFAPAYRSPSSAASATTRTPSSSTTALNIVPGDSSDVLAKINAILEEAASPKVDPAFDQIVQSYFPGAIDNRSLEDAVINILKAKGFTPANTLLATSLCCDELARRLEDDFVKVFGNNFNLGGLAGFPFAGNTGFGAMAAHIPDDGYCFLIYGPHVGISKDGTVGKVERQGIALIDTCCGSAVAASNYLKGITDGGATMVADVQKFTDFQQGAVCQLILPHGKRLSDAENRMVELPLALFDSQDVLMQDIVQSGCGGTKRGLAILGGIQINTNPGVPDYFLPIRFDYMNNQGEILESLLPALTSA